ncbi:hypothetical protein [Foetidibacter luteolus]|uniref:hypothetical protein n=1 Tax=Foetidibacter luteolus TaxID=2608880 RepID=UPI00129ACBC5|nr:hypothetical protein [Foetidibacter luteolus]
MGVIFLGKTSFWAVPDKEDYADTNDFELVSFFFSFDSIAKKQNLSIVASRKQDYFYVYDTPDGKVRIDSLIASKKPLVYLIQTLPANAIGV